jgi:uncharacterized protein (DUF58 family)
MRRLRASATSRGHPGGSPLHERIIAKIVGERSPVPGDRTLTRRNVYILPTRAGVLYGIALLTMLLASINYALSLGFMLTFLLAAIALVSMLHTFRNLSSLVLRPGRCDPVFAGEPAEFSLLAINPGQPQRLALLFEVPGSARRESVDLGIGDSRPVRLAVQTTARGWLQVPRLTVETEYPLGLWRAWSWWQPAMSVLVYPAPEAPGTPLPASSGGDGSGGGVSTSDEDLAGIRPYRFGDSPRRIAWRSMAGSASDALLAKQFEGSARRELRLSWHALPPTLDTETRIARLARWVLDACQMEARWSLELPGALIDTDGGPGHRDRCLEALATLEV